MPRNGKKVRIFSALEVANICGVVNQTAINWIKNSHLKAFTTPGGQYRIYAEDLRSFLEGRGMKVPEEIYELTAAAGVHRILIVDDDRDLNNMLREILAERMEDVEILQAFDGFAAGQILAEDKPEIVILDIDLPGIDGHALCERIKANENLGHPRIISISGLSEEAGEEMINRGADAFLLKPLNFEDLVGTIQSMN